MTEDMLAYQTFERKIIYAFSVLNKEGKLDYYDGLEKIGDTSITDFKIDARDDSDDLINVAKKRIRQYAGTSGLPYKVDISRLAVTKENKFFRDHDVHKVLQRSGIKKAELNNGNEWYRTDVPTIIKAIEAVEEGRNMIDSVPDTKELKEIIFRPEQEEAIKQTTKVFKNKSKMLWNAKMRFGKTLSALQVIKDNGFKKSLIITHRPVVSDGWFEDFNKIFSKNDGYLYGSKVTGEKLNYLKKGDNSFVYFASMQDLRGLAVFGGTYNTENKAVADVDWDFIIVDEAHEGTRTEIAKNVLDIISKDAKLLELSGTPFNILDDYLEDQVFTWDYVMEQEAKKNWSEKHPDKPNPYESLPKVNMYTYEIHNKFPDTAFISTEDKAFNFMEFFKTENSKFKYEMKVKAFLDEITKADSKTNYPFSTPEFRDNLRHTLWLLPSIASCKALKEMLCRHPVFKEEYKIINIVDDGHEDGATDSDLNKVRNAITKIPSETKTITLSVRKLTTGVNIPEWTGIVFLNNTNSPSAYLQATFRAQTPFYDEKMGMKSNAYIFDFAPDRALTVMTSAAKLNSGVGKVNTNIQREQMQKFINFLPILGETGNGMQAYNVDSLLTKLKKVYAEKAVRTGFEDDSLYNDDLLTLTEVDLQDFKDLKKIVGLTNNNGMPKKIDINQQGLTDEEYEQSEKAKNKKPKYRTPEENAAILKVKAAKKQRKTMISILRGISIRIPMMIYGMDLDINTDVDMNRFVDEIDNVSWAEFMPKDVTKLMFKRYAKYYDPEVFIEAGRIIRNRAKSFDELEYFSRSEKIAQLFSTFKNPDKETVLTPWRVVNLQLSETIGGLCYFDGKFENSTIDGNSALRWVDTEITDEVFREDTKILEINSKTGLYPLYIATSLFYKKRNELNTKRAGLFDKRDEEKIIQDILKENIFVIAKTPMAKTITQRTLTGYTGWETNINYVEGLNSKMKRDVNEAGKIVRGEFNNMKFDVIVGNPPYNESDSNSNQGSASPLYAKFITMAIDFNPKFITFITPSVWFTGGKGLDDFRKNMLEDVHFQEFNSYITSNDVFQGVNLRGGVNYFLWNNSYNNQKSSISVNTFFNNKLIDSGMRPYRLDNINLFISENKSYYILNKLLEKELIFNDYENENMLAHSISVRNPFGFPTTFKEFSAHKDNQSILIYGSKKKTGYINENSVTKNTNWINKWKVLTAFANNIGTDLPDDNLNTIISEPGSICTETYLVIGADLGLNEYSSKYLAKYLKTKFVRYLISLAKANQNGTKITYRFVPIQDFTEKSDINWSKSNIEIDRQLYKKYELGKSEIAFIESKIKVMV